MDTEGPVVYCLATVEEPVVTYIGATIDKERRLRQHNGLLVGGAHVYICSNLEHPSKKSVICSLVSNCLFNLKHMLLFVKYPDVLYIVASCILLITC